MNNEFLPITIEEMRERGWYYYDFLCITGDAYVDHPSFGFAIITRVLENAGYRVAVLSQPDWKKPSDFTSLGKPRLGVMITGGNIDSMVAHYSVSKKRRAYDDYTPGGVAGKRPDRAAIVYSNRIKEAFPDLPVIIGGLEASLRRFAHYDYWDDSVRASVLLDSRADTLLYGMCEESVLAVADKLKRRRGISEVNDIRGCVYKTNNLEDCAFPYVICPSYSEVARDMRLYAKAARIQQENQDPYIGHAVVQPHNDGFIVQNPPALPLSREKFDRVYELPYARDYHPSYLKLGGVKAIEEVKFSIIHNRGCFGGCNFCSLAFHQGKVVTSRSHESILREADILRQDKDFKGYIHDVGGPTANFRSPACEKQEKKGLCKHGCLAPTPCANVNAGHTDYLELLRKLRSLPNVKKVFVRSGIRFDYLLLDSNREFFEELVQHHISGQLKVAPEHCSDAVLDAMGKPHFDVYLKFYDRFKSLNKKFGLEQYLVPYFISSHPGATLHDAVKLSEYLNGIGHMPEQVQDFYPTPGTISTCMYYTSLDPMTLRDIYVARDPHEKAMQRALLQWRKPNNRRLVLEALKLTNRRDLIGYGSECLIKPDRKAAPNKRRGKKR